MSWIDGLENYKIKKVKMQETCKAVARISYSIFSSGKETKEPGEKLQLHILSKPKMTSLNETQSKDIYGDS